jgi:DNA (cytosine-5)-methyltransferase 1
MNILNLYCGIGGNRKLWGNDHEITAIELNPDIAKIYKEFFPQDNVIVADAHEYLLNNYQNFDFIWSSPPCPTHSQLRYNLGFKANRKYAKVKAEYPDMKLYEEIILLKYWFSGLWVIENTIPYYEPLLPAIKTGGHIWWSNFNITEIKHGNRGHRGGTVDTLQGRKGFDLSSFDITNKRQILRNCVEPEVGNHILDCAINNSLTLFDKHDTN